MTEHPVQFGGDGALYGVVTRPAGSDTRKLAFLMLNAGLIHRVGPHRLHVRMARALAEDGVTAMRFDLSGIGDSEAAKGSFGFRAQSVADVRSAIDYLAHEHGIQRFVIFGICFGAVNAYWTALADPRVVGLFMFDGFWYPTRWAEPVRMWKRNKAMGWRHSVAAVARRIGRGVGRNDSRERQSADIEFEDMGNPPKAQFAQAMHALVERGVSAFLLYSGSVTQNYSYADQFADAFRGESFVGKIRCDFAVDLDHTVSLIASQQRVVRLARDWVATIS